MRFEGIADCSPGMDLESSEVINGFGSENDSEGHSGQIIARIGLSGYRGSGAAEGIRTPDPRITNAVLYRLSYRGTPMEWRFSNTRGLLTQDSLPADCRGVIESPGRGAYAAENTNELNRVGVALRHAGSG
jgi:hypothetical protein